MSENLRRSQAQFAGIIHETIFPDMVTFETLSQADSLQQFCTYGARFDIDTTATAADEYLSILIREPEPQVFNSAEVAEQLTASNKLLDTFVEGITSAYTYRKRLAPAQGEAERNIILAKVFSGGLSRVIEYMRWSNSAEEGVTEVGNAEQMRFLPLSLLLLGARLASTKHYESSPEADNSLEATDSQEVIDASIDEALQNACQNIQQNKKLTVSKDAPESEKAFAAAMNSLRSTYNLHEDRAFKETLLAMYYTCFGDTSGGDPAQALVTYQNFREYFGKLIGARYSDIKEPQMAYVVLAQAHKKGMKTYEKSNEELQQVISSIEYKLIRTRSAHWLVDNIADGTMRYSEIRKALMLLNSQPFKQPETPTAAPSDTEIPDEYLRWQILPPDLFDDDGNPRVGEGQQDPYDHERQIDWVRLWRLQKYGRSWKGSRFARSNIPNLPKEKQYYAVILPDVTEDGTYIEHAVADHPETGNGMYVWRGEVGIKEGQVALKWEHVMAQPRPTARKLGARCLYHTAGLETNLLDYLTRKPDQLGSKRYAKL